MGPVGNISEKSVCHDRPTFGFDLSDAQDLRFRINVDKNLLILPSSTGLVHLNKCKFYDVHIQEH